MKEFQGLQPPGKLDFQGLQPLEKLGFLDRLPLGDWTLVLESRGRNFLDRLVQVKMMPDFLDQLLRPW
jgi:hypothetical protein